MVKDNTFAVDHVLQLLHLITPSISVVGCITLCVCVLGWRGGPTDRHAIHVVQLQ